MVDVVSNGPFLLLTFQVPLIIIVPHPEVPDHLLLPRHMTATSYHGNQINHHHLHHDYNHGFGSVHVAPV